MRVWALFWFVLLLGAPAVAAPALKWSPAGPVELQRVERKTTMTAPVLELEAKLEIENVGQEPVAVRRVFLRTADESHPLVPRGVTAQFERARGGERLAPGQSRKVVVRWKPGDDAGARQLFGHVVAETPEGAQTSVGVRASLDGHSVLRDHLLSWLVLLPLLGAAIAAVARSNAHRVGRFAVAGQAVLVAWAFSAFDRSVSRLDGNGGYQFIERVPLGGGVEWALGVDGISVVLVCATVVVALAAVAFPAKPDGRGVALLLLADAGVVLSFCALDATLLVGGWAVAALALTVALGDRATALRSGLASLGAVACGAVAVYSVATKAGPSPDLAGALGTSTTYLAEFTRLRLLEAVGSDAVTRPVFFAGLAALLGAGAWPGHGGHFSLIRRAPTPVALFFVGAASSVGFYLLLRVGYSWVPSGTRWASTSLAVLGAVGVLWGAFGVLSTRSFPRLVGQCGVAHGGMVLIALASPTGAGVEAALAQMVSRGLVLATLMVAMSLVAARAGTVELDALSGRTSSSVKLVAGIAFAAAMALPGSSAFVAQVLALTASGPYHPAILLAAAVGWVVLGVGLFRTYTEVFWGEVREGRDCERSLSSGESMSLAPLVAAVALLGVHPGAVLGLAGASALDHAERVDPPGPMQIGLRAPAVREPSSPSPDRRSTGRCDASEPRPAPPLLRPS